MYRPSTRPLPRQLSPLEYPGHFEVRLVSCNSRIRWKKHWVYVTHTLAGEYVGLEEVGEGLWDVYFGPLELGRTDLLPIFPTAHKTSVCLLRRAG